MTKRQQIPQVAGHVGWGMSELEPTGQPVRTAVRAAAAALPGIGGPVAVVLDDVWIPRWQQNVHDFIEQLGSDLEEVAVELFADVDEIKAWLADERVAEVFHRAAQTARVTSSTATRRRCRAAVINAMRQPENAAMNLRFVQLIDELTPGHFALLTLLEDPSANASYAGEVGKVISGGSAAPAAKALDYTEDFVRMLNADVQRLGLGSFPQGMMTAQGLLAKRTSDLGDKLLSFVRHPVAGDAA